MWIVRLALRRPYTFVVMAMLIGVLGLFSTVTLPTDIFPNINIPVVSSVWSYGRLAPDDMQNRIRRLSSVRCEMASRTKGCSQVSAGRSHDA